VKQRGHTNLHLNTRRQQSHCTSSSEEMSSAVCKAVSSCQKECCAAAWTHQPATAQDSNRINKCLAYDKQQQVYDKHQQPKGM
jgi:hypothetical protein